MGKMRENPRYNVLSVRVSDEVIDRIDRMAKDQGTTRTMVLLRVLEGLK